MIRFYRLVDECRVIRLEIKERIDFSLLDLGQIPTVRELVLSNKDYAVQNERKLIVSKLTVKDARLHSFGVFTYTFEDHLLEVFREI